MDRLLDMCRTTLNVVGDREGARWKDGPLGERELNRAGQAPASNGDRLQGRVLNFDELEELALRCRRAVINLADDNPPRGLQGREESHRRPDKEQ